MKTTGKFKLTTVLLLAGFAAIVGYSCNSSPTNNTGTSSFTVAATAIADANKDTTKVVANITASGARVTNATVLFGADTLKFRRAGFPIDSIYSMVKVNHLYYGVGRYKLIVSASNAADSAAVRLPATANITNVVPTNRLALGLRTVTLEWTGADSTDGYILAATLKDSAYHGYGYSMFNTTNTTAGTLPPEAFSPGPTALADTGWYYLYVYAYTGSPDSALTRKLLPVPLPSQLANNLTSSGLGGHLGTVIVVRRDSVHVVAGS